MARKAPGKKLLAAALGSAAAFIAVLVTISFALPSLLEVERSIIVEAPASAVFLQVNRLKNWEAWSPWKEDDPGMTQSYQGPESGAGAVSEWVSGKRGKGTQTIVTSVPDRQVELVLDFGEMSRGRVEFRFEEAGGSGKTEVTWTFESEMGGVPFGRFAVPVLRGEVERGYERGLANLKRLAEETP
jgi:hypothetical protein